MRMRTSKYIVWVKEDADDDGLDIATAIEALPGYLEYEWVDYVD